MASNLLEGPPSCHVAYEATSRLGHAAGDQVQQCAHVGNSITSGIFPAPRLGWPLHPGPSGSFLGAASQHLSDCASIRTAMQSASSHSPFQTTQATLPPSAVSASSLHHSDPVLGLPSRPRMPVAHHRAPGSVAQVRASRSRAIPTSVSGHTAESAPAPHAASDPWDLSGLKSLLDLAARKRAMAAEHCERFTSALEEELTRRESAMGRRGYASASSPAHCPDALPVGAWSSGSPKGRSFHRSQRHSKRRVSHDNAARAAEGTRYSPRDLRLHAGAASEEGWGGYAVACTRYSSSKRRASCDGWAVTSAAQDPQYQ